MGRMRGGDLLLFTAGEETDVRVKLCVGTAHQDLSIRPFLRLQYLFQPGCQGVEGLGGAGRALDDGQGHFLRRQQQGLLQELLAHAPGLDAEWANAAKTQGGDLFPIKAAQHGLFRIGIRAQEDKLVLGQRNWPLLPRAVHGIKFLRRNPFFLKGREQVIGNVDFCPSGVGPGPVRQPVGGEILRRHPYHLGPDADDHIPDHQRRRRPLVHKAPAYFQHPARPTVWIQSLGQICVHMVDFQAHGAPTGQGHAFYKVARKPQTL